MNGGPYISMAHPTLNVSNQKGRVISSLLNQTIDKIVSSPKTKMDSSHLMMSLNQTLPYLSFDYLHSPWGSEEIEEEMN